MPLNRVSAASALALVLFACGDGEEMMPVDPAATIGAGESEFSSLQDGATASVILGPQGGYHIIGSVRAVGIEPGDPDDLGSASNPTTTFTVEQGGSRIDSDGASYTQGLKAASDGSFEMVGRIVILDIINDDDIAGETITFNVSVADVDGITVTDSIDLVAMPDPRNP